MVAAAHTEPPAATGSTQRRRHGRFFYFAPNDVLVPRVDRQCIMRFCDALAKAGLDTEVVSLNQRLDYPEPTQERSFADVYGVSDDFKITVLPCPARQRSKARWLPVWRACAYSAYAGRWLVRVPRDGEPPVFYFKNYLLGAVFLALRRVLRRDVLLVFEIHTPPRRRLATRLLNRFDGVVPVSRILARELKTDYRIDPVRIEVAHQGVDLDELERRRLTKASARRLLDLPLDRRLIVYTGKVHHDSEEVQLLIDAVRRLPASVELVVVGGREDQVDALRQRATTSGDDRIRFVGFVAPADVFPYQWAADVLVTYYPSSIELNKYRASPGKLFEYMASGRPIVASDYPALREALSPGAALFVPPDNAAMLAEGLERVLDDSGLAERLAEQARIDVTQFTWDKRVSHVLALVERIRNPAVGSAG